MKQLIVLSLLFSCQWRMIAQAPPAKNISAHRITQKITIDGDIKPQEWTEASILEGFTELRPRLNEIEANAHKTTIYLGYSDQGIYFAGYCKDSKDSISSELAGRDGFGNNDFVGIVFDTYKDRQNAFEYFITPLNEQMDAKVAPSNEDGEDFSWNSVFESKTKITDEGWTFEIFIPFASIRFSKKDVQDWGVNVVRRRTKTGEQFFWNPIDPNVNGFLTQEGYWNGLKEIKPPLRLQLSPYISYYANHYPNNEGKDITNQVNGGLDLKVGLNQAYTLDATLIPDFGQVQSDQRVLNLTPFEVRFNENRPFFTEGIELFNKGNLFYSRRIGGTPLGFYDVESALSPGEKVRSNPSESKLINATKISGRGKTGLGIAVLNAVSSATMATIEGEDGALREIETSPLTNYNVFVADQTFKNNSSVSFVNTSVLRRGETYDANVSSALFSINNKKNTYNISGEAAISNKFAPDLSKQLGYRHSLGIGKTSGQYNWRLSHSLTDNTFDYNDLGYFTNNNQLEHTLWLGARWNKPKGIYNNLRMNINATTNHLYKEIVKNGPSLQVGEINFNANMQLKNLWFIGTFNEYTFTNNDYYEPRIPGRFFTYGQSILNGLWIESNDNKPYFFETELFVRRYIDFYDLVGVDLSIENNYRFSKRFLLSHEVEFKPRYNSVGFGNTEELGDKFSRRDIKTVTNEIAFKYSFTNRMGLTFVARHYASAVKSKEIYQLKSDGTLMKDASTDASLGNRNVNFFNIDMVYTWQIAQGSFVNIVWKNAAANFNKNVDLSYRDNLRETLRTDQNNNLSVKVIYFLDYNTIVNSNKG